MPPSLYEHNMSPFCRSVKVLAKVAGIELNLVSVDVFQGGNRSKEFMEINPFHQIPGLVDGDLKLFESRAIMTYLLNKYAPDSDLYPKDPAKRAKVDAVLMMATGSIANLYGARGRSIFRTGKDLDEPAIHAAKDTLGGLDRLLSRHKYAAGDKMTVADIDLVHTLSIVDIATDDMKEFSNVKDYFERIKEELGEVYHEMSDEQVEVARNAINSKRIPA